MAEPVAWKVIESGWAVYDSAGQEVGTVDEIAGDENADIFDGLAIKDSVFGRSKYVPAEVVGTIEEGAVHLTISGDAVSTLEDMRAAPQEEILPEKSRWYRRLAWWMYGDRGR